MRRVAVAIGLLAATAALAACGGGSVVTETVTVTAPAEPAPPPVTETVAEPTSAAETEPVDETVAEENAEEPETAGAFILAYWKDLNAGQAGLVWRRLIPGQKKSVPKKLYVRCHGEAGGVADEKSVRVVKVFRDDIAIPGVPAGTVAKGVTLESENSAGEVTRYTRHAVQVDGRWGWVLSPDAIAAFSAGNCPPIYVTWGF